jgi:hypothetical protein
MKGLLSDAPIESLRAELAAGLDPLPDHELRHCHYIFSVTFERALGDAAVAKLAADNAMKPQSRPRKLPRNVVCFPGVTLADLRKAARKPSGRKRS